MHTVEQDIHELYFELNESIHFAVLLQYICLKFYTDLLLMISEATASWDGRWFSTQYSS